MVACENSKGNMLYCIAGKFGRGKFSEFAKSSVITQTKTIQISTYNK